MKELKKIEELKKEGFEKSKKIEELKEEDKALIEAMRSGENTTETMKKINSIDNEIKQLKEQERNARDEYNKLLSYNTLLDYYVDINRIY